MRTAAVLVQRTRLADSATADSQTRQDVAQDKSGSKVWSLHSFRNGDEMSTFSLPGQTYSCADTQRQIQPAPAFVRTLAVRTPVQHPVTTTFGTAGLMHLLEPSHSNANDCDFGATASFSPLPLDVHMHMHTLRMCRFPTLRTRSGSNTRTVAALAKPQAASPVSRRAKLSQRCTTCCVTVWPDASPHTAVLGHTGEYWRILADTALVLPTYCDTPRLDIPKYDAVHQYPYCRRRLAYLRTS